MNSDKILINTDFIHDIVRGGEIECAYGYVRLILDNDIGELAYGYDLNKVRSDIEMAKYYYNK